MIRLWELTTSSKFGRWGLGNNMAMLDLVYPIFVFPMDLAIVAWIGFASGLSLDLSSVRPRYLRWSTKSTENSWGTQKVWDYRERSLAWEIPSPSSHKPLLFFLVPFPFECAATECKSEFGKTALSKVLYDLLKFVPKNFPTIRNFYSPRYEVVFKR